MDLANISISDDIIHFARMQAKIAISVFSVTCYADDMMIPAQCRAARALLDWSQQDLADRSKVGNATIRNFEAGRSEPRHAILEALQRTLEAEGVEFIGPPGIEDNRKILSEVRIGVTLKVSLGKSDSLDSYRL
jgi:DNA-binding XRE family transcriptional regulator